MTNAYTELTKKHSAEFNNFPMIFAFSDKQFKEGMGKLGLEVTDTDKICASRAGGYYLKTDSPRLREMMDRHTKDMGDAISADITGEGFIFNMFDYELSNHEYCYTYDITDTIDAIGLTIEEINGNEALKHGLKLAKIAQRERDC